MRKEDATRRNLRSNLAKEILSIADFDPSLGEIPSLIELIHYELNNPNLNEANVIKIRDYLDKMKESCMLVSCKISQNYHAFEMLRHFAQCIGLKYDPMF